MLPFYQKTEADDLKKTGQLVLGSANAAKSQKHSTLGPSTPSPTLSQNIRRQRLYYCVLTVLTFVDQQECYQARKTEGKDGRW